MKRRVIAIAVVVAAVSLVGLNWDALLQTVMLRKVVISLTSPGAIVIQSEQRWRGRRHGSQWVLNLDNRNVIHFEFENGDYARGSVLTQWNANGTVHFQARMNPSTETPKPPPEERRSPPWWPHPPLIDLREFEE